MAETRKLRIGYALEPKKIKTFITPSLLNHTHNRGMDMVEIDTDRPLIQQGPFDIIIHKLYSQEWKQRLIDFSSQNPTVFILDSPLAIERLHDRVSMLDVVTELVQFGAPIVTTPKQVIVYDSDMLFDLNALKELKFPVIAKPLVADGSANSHNMALVFNSNGLQKVEPPVVLQEFVNHGGVIFKVYVVGKYVNCVRRSSLPDISNEKLATLGDIMSFSQISNLNSSGYKPDTGDVEMPPLNYVDEVANALRQALSLHLFNFDMIRDSNGCYYVIDINYFPGYAKMPSYESVLTDFFRDIVKGKPSSVMAQGKGIDIDELTN